jgi:methionyl-tRNA synthetase
VKVLIGGAWPYANGPLHIGHIAGLLPGDVIARYYRTNGDDVYYVSGSDCHGTPVIIRAGQEGKTPEEISDRYHKEFMYCFEKLGFSYDYYGKTTQPEHVEFVKDFHKKLYESDYVYEKETLKAYCSECGRFLPDRYVKGVCPKCGAKSRGDQCDHCGSVMEPELLLEPECSICGRMPEFRKTKHLYIATSKLEPKIRELLYSQKGWRKNAVSFTMRYLDEGLRDRALTRDLDWGIQVPKEGYDDKKIYIWAENVLGYLSMSKIVAKKRGEAFKDLWGKDALHYYIHAKDNIPFHTIILPALIMAHGEELHLPDYIISNEYLTLEGRKISTSDNWAIWVKDIIDHYDPDSLRYFLITNGPEKKDTDFSWHNYVKVHNGELLGNYGNFINRTLVFIEKYYDGVVPAGIFPINIVNELNKLYMDAGKFIREGKLKEALSEIFQYIRFANKYFDAQMPWITRNEDKNKCANTMYTCVQLVVNFANLLEPFLPFSSEKVLGWFDMKPDWNIRFVPAGTKFKEAEILFKPLEKNIAEEELDKLVELKRKTG